MLLPALTNYHWTQLEQQRYFGNIYQLLHFQAPLNQVADLRALTKPLIVWNPFFSGHSQLAQANISSRYSSLIHWLAARESSGYQLPAHVEILYGLPWGCFFILLIREYPEIRLQAKASSSSHSEQWTSACPVTPLYLLLGERQAAVAPCALQIPFKPM